MFSFGLSSTLKLTLTANSISILVRYGKGKNKPNIKRKATTLTTPGRHNNWSFVVKWMYFHQHHIASWDNYYASLSWSDVIFGQTKFFYCKKIGKRCKQTFPPETLYQKLVLEALHKYNGTENVISVKSNITISRLPA